MAFYVLVTSKGPITLLTASHGSMCHSAELESSMQLNFGATQRHHMAHQVHVDGINGKAALRRLLTCENVSQRVAPSKV